SQLQGVNGTYTTISTSISQTPIYNTKLFNNTISNQQLLETITIGNEYVSSIARNDIDQTFTVAQQNANLTNYTVSNMSQNWQTTSATANAIFTKNGEDIDAGYA
ncbi:MAG: hypothetical protein ACK55I_17310, partial [bacterium]